LNGQERRDLAVEAPEMASQALLDRGEVASPRRAHDVGVPVERADGAPDPGELEVLVAGISDMEPISHPAFEIKHAARLQPAIPPIRNT